MNGLTTMAANINTTFNNRDEKTVFIEVGRRRRNPQDKESVNKSDTN